MREKLLSRKDKKIILEATNNFINFCRPLFPFVIPYKFSIYSRGRYVIMESEKLGFRIKFLLEGGNLSFVAMDPGRCNGRMIASVINQFSCQVGILMTYLGGVSFPIDRINFMLTPGNDIDYYRLSSENLGVDVLRR